MDGDNSNNIDLVMTIDENGDNGESKDQHQRDTEKYHKHLNFSNFQLPGWEKGFSTDQLNNPSPDCLFHKDFRQIRILEHQAGDPFCQTFVNPLSFLLPMFVMISHVLLVWSHLSTFPTSVT